MWERLAGFREFGCHGDGLPGPEELSNEEKRLLGGRFLAERSRRAFYGHPFIPLEEFPSYDPNPLEFLILCEEAMADFVKEQNLHDEIMQSMREKIVQEQVKAITEKLESLLGKERAWELIAEAVNDSVPIVVTIRQVVSEPIALTTISDLTGILEEPVGDEEKLALQSSFVDLSDDDETPLRVAMSPKKYPLLVKDHGHRSRRNYGRMPWFKKKSRDTVRNFPPTMLKNEEALWQTSRAFWSIGSSF